jgi:hypothetical protein
LKNESNLTKFYKNKNTHMEGKVKEQQKKTNIQPKYNTQKSKHNNGGHKIKLPIIAKGGKRTTYGP